MINPSCCRALVMLTTEVKENTANTETHTDWKHQHISHSALSLLFLSLPHQTQTAPLSPPSLSLCLAFTFLSSPAIDFSPKQRVNDGSQLSRWRWISIMWSSDQSFLIPKWKSRLAFGFEHALALAAGQIEAGETLEELRSHVDWSQRTDLVAVHRLKRCQ